jgi:hypothetical protein
MQNHENVTQTNSTRARKSKNDDKQPPPDSLARLNYMRPTMKLELIPPGVNPVTLAPRSVVALCKGLNNRFDKISSESHVMTIGTTFNQLFNSPRSLRATVEIQYSGVPSAWD